jgi:hypothetical protein
MNREDLLALYRTWTDEQLLQAFTKKDDYTPVALEAMLAVIDERKISGGAESILQKDAERRQEWHAEEKRQYERQMIGEDLDARRLALKSKNEKGEYFFRDLASREKLTGEILVIVLTIMALIVTIVFAFQPMPFDYAPLYPFVAFLAGASLTIKLFKKRTAWISLKKEGSKTVLTLSDQSYNFKATVPFEYDFYWELSFIRRGLSKIHYPTLSIRITNAQNETILVRQRLGAIHDGPPDWPMHGEIEFPKFPPGVNVYHDRPLKPLDLVRLKKILEGVHELHDEKTNSAS